MVIDNQNAIVEATAYQAYGTKEDLVINADKKVRDKFTGKEYDNEGVNYAQIEFDMTFGFSTAVDGQYPGSIMIFFDGESNPTEVIYVKNIEYVNCIKNTINLTTSITLDKILFVFPANNSINMERCINMPIQTGQKLKITGNYNTLADLYYGNPPNCNTIALTTSIGEAEKTGTGLVYFGKRYLDDAVGWWVSVDPKNQYADYYSYTGGNPIILVDNDGKAAQIVIGAAIGGTISCVTSAYTLFYEQGASVSDMNAWGKLAFATVIGAGTGALVAGMPTSAKLATKVATGAITGLLSAEATKYIVEGKAPNTYNGKDVLDLTVSTVAGGGGSVAGHFAGGIDKAFGGGVSDKFTDILDVTTGSIASGFIEGGYLLTDKNNFDAVKEIDYKLSKHR
jgi:RHS repeat-associated protein